MHTSLFSSDPLFDRYFHNSPVGMVITAITDGHYADVNPAFAQMMGCSRDDLIGQPFRVMGLGDSDVRMMVIKFLTQVRILRDIPLLLESTSGEQLTCIASTQMIEIEGESHLFTILQDITEHERAQESLRASENRFRLFFRSIPLPLLVIDGEDFHILEANPRACELYGYSTDEFSGLTMRDLMPPEDWPAYQKSIQANSGSDTGQPLICRQILKNGAIIEVDVISYTFSMEGQTVNLSIIQDVTEQRAIQSALAASEERLRIVANVSTDAIWSRDLPGKAVRWNAGLTSLFGYHDDVDLTHDWWLEQIHPDERPRVNESIESAFASGDRFWSSEYRFLRADGTYVKVLDRGHIVRDANGRPIRFLGAMVDITEQLQVAEAASRAALEERQRLARDLHESVTQSLYSLSLMAEAARRRSIDAENALTIDYISRLGELSRQALRQLRLMVYELRPTQLAQAGLEAALRHRLEAVEQRAGIRFRLEDNCVTPIPPTLQGDIFRLAQEALNYSLRSAAATAISVRLWNEPGRLILEIKDDGQGIGAPTSGSANDLASIQHRVEALGGMLDVITTNGGGTIMQAGIPLPVTTPVTANRGNITGKDPNVIISSLVKT